MTDTTIEAHVTVAHGALSNVGNRRRVNEDSFHAEFPLYLVADGMGGHQAGDVASAQVVETMRSVIPAGDFTDPATLTDALFTTARVLSDLGMSQGNPGSTMTGLVFSTHRGIPCARIFNIGDSRTYLLTGNEFSQVTVDHSEFQELKDSGALTEAEQRAFTRRNVLTKALGAGFSPSIPIDQFIVPLTAGDRIVICSDGLSGEVTDALIEMVIRGIADPQTAADELIEMALKAGGKDNATVIVLDIQDVHPQWETTSVGESTQNRPPANLEDTLPNERLTYLRGLTHRQENSQSDTATQPQEHGAGLQEVAN